MLRNANSKVIAVFESCTQKAPCMTHALSELGNGDMGSGIITVWQAGRNNGFVQGSTVTAMLFVAGMGVYKVVSTIREERRIKKLIHQLESEDNSDLACC